jgi:hypothetical protein
MLSVTPSPMPGRSSKSGLLLALILLSAIYLFYSFSYTETYLEISGENKTCYIPVMEKEVVSVSFIHSVELSKEIDFYRIENNSLVLFKTLTKSAGWGLPSTEKNFSTVEYKGEKWFQFGILRNISVLRISVNPFNHYTVETGKYMINLDDLGKTVTLKVVVLNPVKATLVGGCQLE